MIAWILRKIGNVFFDLEPKDGDKMDGWMYRPMGRICVKFYSWSYGFADKQCREAKPWPLRWMR